MTIAGDETVSIPVTVSVSFLYKVPPSLVPSSVSTSVQVECKLDSFVGLIKSLHLLGWKEAVDRGLLIIIPLPLTLDLLLRLN